MKPQPTEAEIQFILDAISDYLTVKVPTPPGIAHLHTNSVILRRRFDLQSNAAVMEYDLTHVSACLATRCTLSSFAHCALCRVPMQCGASGLALC